MLDADAPRTDLTEELDSLRQASMTFAAVAIAFELEAALVSLVRETDRLLTEARAVLTQTKEPVVTASA